MADKPFDEEAVFKVAREIGSPQARAEYLKQACGDDKALFDRLHVLLRVYDEENSFLESPPPGLAATIEPPSIAERPGQTIGRYKLLQEIGEGGMGVVCMAEQQEPVRRKVALKIIKPGMDTRAVVARFESERQALALMDHPNIAKVLDAGATESGRPYFVMELVHGIPLTEYCDQEQLTTRERLELFVQVCHAVQHAHQKGIIHRDLKPSNVMVTLYDGVPVPKIIDFGVAKATGGQLTEKTVFTGYGQMIGTPLYMSPEQADLSALDVDTRSDIYSLGVLLYELLTGRTPFDRERLREAGFDEVRRVIREEEPPRPSHRLSTLGAEAMSTITAHRGVDARRLGRLLRGDLDWIVMKALEKDRTRRYESASALAADVQRYLADEPVEARPPTLVDRVAKWSRRHRPLVWSAVALLAMCAVGSSLSAMLIALEKERTSQANEGLIQQLDATQRAEALAKQQEELANQQRKLAEKQKQLAVAQKEEAVRNLYVAQMRLAVQDWKVGQTLRLEGMLDRYLPQPGEPDLRGWEWYYLVSLCHSNLLTLRHGSYSGPVAWSPDGRRIAAGSHGETIQFFDADTGKELLNLAGHGRRAVRAIAFSPDSRQLASTGDDQLVKIWDLAVGKEIHTLRGHTRTAPSLAWSPDGKRLASGSYQTFKIWDPATGKEILEVPGHTENVTSLAWSPDSKRLASGSADRSIKIWDAATGREMLSLKGVSSPVNSVAWSADGRRLASAGDGDSTARLWDTATGEPVSTLDSTFESVINDEKILPWRSYLAWNPDSRRLALAGMDGFLRIWDTAAGGEVRMLRGHTHALQSVAWSPDGRRLVTTGEDKTVRIWEADADQEGRTIHGTGWLGCALAWSPDGRRIAAHGQQLARRGEKAWDHFKIWEAATGRELLELHGDTAEIETVAWSPDGSRLASGGGPTIILWDAATGKAVLTLRGHTARVLSVAWSPDGRRLASGSDDRTARIWDAATGKAVLTLRGHASWVCKVAWSPEGRRLATISDGAPGTRGGAPKIWDAALGREILTVKQTDSSRGPSSVAWSPDGRRLASAGNLGTIHVWDAATGDEQFSLRGHRGYTNLAWHPDGRRLASSGTDWTVRIWDLATREETFSFPGNGSLAVWSPDGKRLATGRVDAMASGKVGNMIKIWDASVGYQFAAGPEFQFHRAGRLAAQERREEALAIFMQLVKEHPEVPEYRCALARLLDPIGRAANPEASPKSAPTSQSPKPAAKEREKAKGKHEG